MSYSMKILEGGLLQGILQGSSRGYIKGNTRNVNHSSLDAR